MTAYVKQLGRRDEVAELIEWHFEIIWVFLPDDQSNRTHSRAGPVFGFHIHRRILLSGSKFNRAPRMSNPREIDAENQHGDRERRRKQRRPTGLRDLDDLIATDPPPLPFKPEPPPATLGHPA